MLLGGLPLLAASLAIEPRVWGRGGGGGLAPLEPEAAAAATAASGPASALPGEQLSGAGEAWGGAGWEAGWEGGGGVGQQGQAADAADAALASGLKELGRLWSEAASSVLLGFGSGGGSGGEEAAAAPVPAALAYSRCASSHACVGPPRKEGEKTCAACCGRARLGV